MVPVVTKSGKQKPPTPPKPVQYQPVNYKRLIDNKYASSSLLQLVDDNNYDSISDRSLTDDTAPLIEEDIDRHTSPAGRVKPPLLPKPLNVPPKLPDTEKRNTNPFRLPSADVAEPGQRHETQSFDESTLSNGATNPFHSERRSTNPFDFFSANTACDETRILRSVTNFEALIAEKYQQQQQQQHQHQQQHNQQPLPELKNRRHHRPANQHENHAIEQQRVQTIERNVVVATATNTTTASTSAVSTTTTAVNSIFIHSRLSSVVTVAAAALTAKPLSPHFASCSPALVDDDDHDLHRPFNSDKECLLERGQPLNYGRCAKKPIFESQPPPPQEDKSVAGSSNRSSWRSCSDAENGDEHQLQRSRSSSIAENDYGWIKTSSPRSSSSGGSHHDSPVVKIKIAKDGHLPGSQQQQQQQQQLEEKLDSPSAPDDESIENGGNSSESSYSVRRRIKTWFGSFGKGNKNAKRRDSTFYVEPGEGDEEDGGVGKNTMWDAASVSSNEDDEGKNNGGGDTAADDANDDDDRQQRAKEPELNGNAQQQQQQQLQQPPPLTERERKERKALFVVRELISSEKVFIDVLSLLTRDFVDHVRAADGDSAAAIPDVDLNKIINTLPQLKSFNEDLLKDFEERMAAWSAYPKISDIIIKKGPFLKLFSTYIQNFEKQCYYLDEYCHKYARFGKAVKDFEASDRCKKLTLKHYMLKPVQRLPQYRLLLEDYLSHQYSDSIDYDDTQQALKIVCEVADHANRSVQQGVHLSKLLQLQAQLGNYEVIKPGREFIKEGELYKYSRKETHLRYFILLNDCLLYTSYYGSMFSLTVKHKLPLAGMKVCIPKIEDYNNEFNLITTTRSFTLRARSPEERNEWVAALERTIKEHNRKQLSFSPKFVPQTLQAKPLEIGKQAPVWIPDHRVTMCQVCTAEFKVTFRRHHCRACGKVVCGNCSDNKAPLQYRNFQAARVCDDCYAYLLKEYTESKDAVSKSVQIQLDLNDADVALAYDNVGTTFKKQDPHNSKKSLRKYIPTRLKEVPANVSGLQSGWLHRKNHKSWKRYWFVLKEQVLYVYKASEDVKALETIPVLGYVVETFKEASSSYEDIDSKLVFQLAHAGQPPFVFYADTETMAERWIAAFQDAVSIS